MIRVSLVAALALLSGCFDSLLDSPCRAGYDVENGACVLEHGTTAPDALTSQPPDAATPPTDVATGDAGTVVDGSPVATPDGSPDGSTCTDTQSDPLNCGVCGHNCASGICTAGVCEGDPRGHVIAIGHDYAASNAPMVRVLGNAAALGEHQDLAIGRWSSPSSAVTTALANGLAAVGRTSHAVILPTTPSATAFASADVIIIDPRAGDGDVEEATGVVWSAAFADFFIRGGVVIVIEGTGGTNYRLARGANLFQASAPVVVTGAHLQVVAGADAVTQQVISPYFAASSSVAFSNLPAVISAPGVGAVVFHEARP